MNIQEAKTEICNTLRAYLAKDENGYYTYPLIRQRPLLLIGPPGIGKTAIMEQAAAECGVGLVAYTITHHTRQSAIGLIIGQVIVLYIGKSGGHLLNVKSVSYTHLDVYKRQLPTEILLLLSLPENRQRTKPLPSPQRDRKSVV